MPIRKNIFDELDVSKLHSEANQLLNQRLTITTTAITVVCLVLAWFIPSKTSFTNNGNIGVYLEMGKNNYGSHGNILYFGTALLFALLVVLFWLSSNIKTNLMFITSYLIVNEKSNWEKYREIFNDENEPKGKTPWVYAKYLINPHFRVSQFVIFCFLWMIVLIYPSIIQQKIIPFGCCWHCFFGFCCIITLLILRRGSKNEKEKDYKIMWLKIINNRKENV